MAEAGASQRARAAFLAEAAAERGLGVRSAIGAAICVAAALLAGQAAMIGVDPFGLAPETGAGALIVALIALSALTPALAALSPLLHGRGFDGLWGAARRPRGRALALGAAAAVAAGAGALALEAAAGALVLAPGPRPSVGLVALVALLVATQATAEELFFRGYLLKATARLAARSPILWAAPSVAFFTAFHYSPEAEWHALLYPLLFAVFASALVWRTGGVSAGVGFHVAHNWIALLVFSEPAGVTGVGPLRLDPDAPRLPLFIDEFAIAAASLWLLLRLARPERPSEAA